MSGPWEDYKPEKEETAAAPWEDYADTPKTKSTSSLDKVRAALVTLARNLTFGQSDKIAASMLGLNEEEAMEYKRQADKLIKENPEVETAVDVASLALPGAAALKGAKVAKKGVKKAIGWAKDNPEKALGATIAASGDPLTGAAVGLLGRQFATTRGQRAMSKGFGWLEKKGKQEKKELKKQLAKANKKPKTETKPLPADKKGLTEALKPRIKVGSQSGKIFDKIQDTVKPKQEMGLREFSHSIKDVKPSKQTERKLDELFSKGKRRGKPGPGKLPLAEKLKLQDKIYENRLKRKKP